VRLGALVCRRYIQVMSERRAYPSDLSDARWELVEPVLAAWRSERRRRALAFGRPPEHGLREIMNAILYVDRTGVQWRYLPHDFPLWETVYGYFAKWQKGGVSPSSTACCGSWCGRRKDAPPDPRRVSSTRRA
jgi:transposase